MSYKKVLVTGGGGLVATHLKEVMPDAMYVTSSEYDLRRVEDAKAMFRNCEPDHVIHCAAVVGGIQANMRDPVRFLEDNILINTNTIKEAYRAGVTKLTAVLSTCAYPDTSEKYPMTERDLHNGPPAKSNFGYSYSKRVLATQIDLYNMQYHTNYNYVTPCNLYGEHDFRSDKLNNLHFVSSMINKIRIAEQVDAEFIDCWGTGTPMRQFMYSGDLAKIIQWVVDSGCTKSFNVANENLSIKDMVDIIQKACGTEFPVIWLRSKPDGQFRKDVSDEKFQDLYGDFKYTTLEEGVKKVYEYLKNK